MRVKGGGGGEQAEKGQQGFLVGRQGGGRRHGAFGAGGEFGGKAQALAAARRHDGQLCRRRPPADRRDFAERMTSRNSSGRVGVSLTRSVASNGKAYESFSASCSIEKGRRITKKFSISRHGRKKAYELACRWRDAMVRRMER